MLLAILFIAVVAAGALAVTGAVEKYHQSSREQEKRELAQLRAMTGSPTEKQGFPCSASDLPLLPTFLGTRVSPKPTRPSDATPRMPRHTRAGGMPDA